MEVCALLFVCFFGGGFVRIRKCPRIASYCFTDLYPTPAAFAMSDQYLYISYTPFYNPLSPSPALTLTGLILTAFTILSQCWSFVYAHYTRCKGVQALENQLVGSFIYRINYGSAYHSRKYSTAICKQSQPIGLKKACHTFYSSIEKPVHLLYNSYKQLFIHQSLFLSLVPFLLKLIIQYNALVMLPRNQKAQSPVT